MRTLIFLALFLMLVRPLSGQTPPEAYAFEHLTVVDGLPDPTVVAMIQDHLGFLWVGTRNGLVKYDGYSYTVYKPDPHDPHSLGGRTIFALHEEASGNLWVGTTDAGLYHFDRATERFTRYAHDPNDAGSLSDDVVLTLFGDAAGTLWVGTGGGSLNRLDPSAEAFTRYTPDASDPKALHGDGVYALFEDRDGVLWVGAGNGGLHRLDRDTGVFTSYQHDPANPASLSGKDANVVFEDQAGVLWVGTEAGLNRFDRATGTFTAYRHDSDDPTSLSHDNVVSLYESPTEPGVLWVGIYGGDASPGLNRFDTAAGVFTRFAYDPEAPTGISANRVLSMLEVPEGSGALWFGTLGGGISKLDRRAPRFPYHRHDPLDPNSLSGNEVMALHEDQQGSLWIGTWGAGLNRLDQATGVYTHYRHASADPQSLGSDLVMALYEDREGVLWVGTWGGGLNRFDPATDGFTSYRHDPGDPTSLSSDEVVSLYEDRQGVLWVGTWDDGLNRFDRTTGRFERYQADAGHGGTLSDNGILAILEAPDEPGVLWLVTEAMACERFDTATGQATVLPFTQGGLGLRSAYIDKAGRVWLGTHKAGLVRYDPRNGTHTAYGEDEGLAHESVLGVQEDEEGMLWVSTARGLSRFDPQTETFHTYDLSEKLQGNKFGYAALHRSQKSGTLFFGGNRGFIAFHPDDIKENPHVPPIVLTDFKLFTESVPIGEGSPLEAHISITDEVRLAHWQNDVSFSFVALNYRMPEHNKYAYTLEPYEAQWREVGTQRTADYTNLEPGTYVFRVIGSNDDDLWNEQGAALRLVITPPWWQTRWASVLFLIGFGLGMYGLVRWRVWALEHRARHLETVVAERTAEVIQQKATIEGQAARLQELDKMKSRFFVNLSHEFRTPLTLILGPVQDMLNGIHGAFSDPLRRRLEVMQRSGFRLVRLINQLLDLSKLESGNMRLRAHRGALLPFLKGIVLSFASMAERKRIMLQFSTALQDDDVLDLYYDQDKLEKVMYNLLSNAFKFTPEGGKIQVTVTCERSSGVGRIIIKVRDTGPGLWADEVKRVFDRFYQAGPRQEGTGIGLALAKELVALHGGVIRVDSTPEVGSTFTVHLPLGVAHLTPEERVDGELEEEDTEARRVYRDVALKALEETSGVSAEEDLAASGGSAPTVLLVEDNPDVRAYMRSHLIAFYDIVEAKDGLEGLERAKQLQPDLIISDVMMPEMDGYALCRALKADETLNHIPVILLTAKASEESKVEGLETGADDYIYKPFSADELLARAENLIEIRRLLRRRFSREVVAVEPSEVSLPSADVAFLERVQAIVEAHLANSNFGVDWLADEVGLSPRQLRRRLKELTNLTTGGYIRSMRLQRAAQLLEQQAGTVSEIAYAVGFQDPKHFSKLFRQVFGVAPSHLREKSDP